MRTFWKILIPVGLVVILAVGAGLWWFLRDDSPAEVSLESAIESVTTTSGAPGGSDSEGTISSDGIAGTWTVDTQTGTFDFESATGTFAGFRIQEELSSIGSTTAVGRTGDVTGSITIEGTSLTEATFEVDLTTVTTNEQRRDDKVQSALDTGEFPTATFTLTEPVDLGASAANGDAVTVTAKGDLTIHGVTQQVEFPLEAQLVEGTIVVVGSIDISFADFDVTVPTAQVVLSVEDHGIVEVQLLLTR